MIVYYMKQRNVSTQQEKSLGRVLQGGMLATMIPTSPNSETRARDGSGVVALTRWMRPPHIFSARLERFNPSTHTTERRHERHTKHHHLGYL